MLLQILNTLHLQLIELLRGDLLLEKVELTVEGGRREVPLTVVLYTHSEVLVWGRGGIEGVLLIVFDGVFRGKG